MLTVTKMHPLVLMMTKKYYTKFLLMYILPLEKLGRLVFSCTLIFSYIFKYALSIDTSITDNVSGNFVSNCILLPKFM